MLEKKERFYPNCEKTEEGLIMCQPILQKGDITLRAEEPIVLRPTGTSFEIIKGKGASEELISRLEQHFIKRKL